MRKVSLDKLYIILIIVGVVVSARFAFEGDLFFHTDIARDFLLMEEVWQTKRPTLIGPRSGGIEGLFHGPAWIYLHMPVFILSGGNPVWISWFWVGLNVLAILITFLVARKIYSNQVGLAAAAIVASASFAWTHNLLNPFGAYLLAPFLFYFSYRYFIDKKPTDLVLVMLLLGFSLQFQMAFAGPLALLIGFQSLWLIIKNRKWSHFFLFTLILIPLSTFLVFELRHDWLQTKSLLKYLQTGHAVDFEWLPYLYKRLRSAVFHAINLTPGHAFGALASLAVFGVMIWQQFKKSSKKFMPIALFLYWYFGYWLIALLFKGEVWSYYYWPFFPLIVIIFAGALHSLVKQQFFALITLTIIGINLLGGIHSWLSLGKFVGISELSWQFYFRTAIELQKYSSYDRFGYFIYSPDQYGYQMRYAMHQVFSPEIAVGYKKLPETLLLISPQTQADNFFTAEWWKREQVKLDREPSQGWDYDNGYRVEWYELNESEQNIDADSNLIQDMHFR